MASKNILSYFCKAKSTTPSVTTAQSDQPTCDNVVVSDIDVDELDVTVANGRAGDNIDNGSCSEINEEEDEDNTSNDDGSKDYADKANWPLFLISQMHHCM